MSETVFVSYSSQDKFFAELLGKILAERGFAVWRDREALRAGEEWRLSIDKGIRESFAIILVLSRKSESSHYVTYEWASAMGQGKPILPLLLDECERHPKIEPIQYIDFRNHVESTWDGVIHRLQEIKDDPERLVVSQTAGEGNRQLSDTEKKLIVEIEGYLNQKGFRMMSFDRMRDKKFTDLKDKDLDALIGKVDHMGTVKLKGGVSGVKLL